MSMTYYDALGKSNTKKNPSVIEFATQSGYPYSGFKIVDILDIDAVEPIIEVIGVNGVYVRLRVNRNTTKVWYPSEGFSMSYVKIIHVPVILNSFLTKEEAGSNKSIYQKFKDGEYDDFTYVNNRDGDKDNNYKYTTKVGTGVFITYDDINAMMSKDSELLDPNTKSKVWPTHPPCIWDEPIKEILTSEEEQAKQAKQAASESVQQGVLDSTHGGKRRSKYSNKRKKSSKRAKRSKSRRTRRQRK